MSYIFYPDLVLSAYREGYFPMAEDRYGPVYWHSPDPRAIFPLKELKPSLKTLKQIQKCNFTYSINNRFFDVINACAEREDTWINEEIIGVYTALYERKFAHSVEVYQAGELVGGLYGVSINSAFFGESMFNTVSNAAKGAFYFLVEHLKKRDFILLDSQYLNPFTQQLGAIEIPKKKYLSILRKALDKNCSFK